MVSEAALAEEAELVAVRAHADHGTLEAARMSWWRHAALKTSQQLAAKVPVSRITVRDLAKSSGVSDDIV